MDQENLQKKIELIQTETDNLQKRSAQLSRELDLATDQIKINYGKIQILNELLDEIKSGI